MTFNAMNHEIWGKKKKRMTTIIEWMLDVWWEVREKGERNLYHCGEYFAMQFGEHFGIEIYEWIFTYLNFYTGLWLKCYAKLPSKPYEIQLKL